MTAPTAITGTPRSAPTPEQFDHVVSRETLYTRFDAIASGRAQGDGRSAHEDVRTRLFANRRAAEAKGWTACALERQGGGGRLRVAGVPPAGGEREVIPDWLTAG